ASAVVNFAQLAEAEARAPAPSGQPRSRAIPFRRQVEDSSRTSGPAPAQSTATDQASPSGPSTAPSTNYLAVEDGPDLSSGFSSIPPDTMGAVGLTKNMVTLNNNYRIQDKTAGST